MLKGFDGRLKRLGRRQLLQAVGAVGGGALLGKSLDQNHDRQQNRDNGYRCR